MFLRSSHVVLAAIALGTTWAGTVCADEGEPPSDGATLMRRVDRDPPPPELRPWRGLEPRFGREMTWSRWMLADMPIGNDDDGHRQAPWLDLADLRGDALQLRPEATSSAISALGSVTTAGLPMLGVFKNGRLRQRHFLRAFFRSKGVALVWRIEF